MTKIERVGVTFPPDLLKEFDQMINEIGYDSRSKAVHDAVRMFISEKQELGKESGVRAGILMILYDHEVRGLESLLTHIQHHYKDIILSSMHIHLSDRDCLETVAVKGDSAEIKNLRDELTKEKGVKVLKTMLVSA
ncbi:MAG: nickel-responsive transcriptional regulator NikR [Thermoproteota archaeon]